MLELDALRGIAAMAVVIYHLVYRYHELYGHQGLAVYWSYFGQYGVQLFFMISGFVIYWTLERIDRPIEFVISRFSRLYPVFWVAVIVTFGVTTLIQLPDRTVDIATALHNLLMFHEYFAVDHVDGVYWTLTLELTFYAWVFVLLLCRQKHWSSAMLLTLVAANLMLHQLSDVPRWLSLLTLDGYAHFFLFGVALYDWQQRRNRKLAVFAIAVAVGISLMASTVVISAIYLLLMLLFFTTLKGYLPLIGHPVLVWLGAISYSLYLIHQNVGYALLYQLQDTLPSWMAVILSIAVVTALAYGLNRFVEVPSNHGLRQRLKRRLLS